MNILDINKKFRPTMRIYAFSWEAWCLISRTEGEARGSPGGSFRLPAEDSNLPERPIEIRVWYLRGALDDDIGMIRALKVPGTQGTG